MSFSESLQVLRRGKSFSQEELAAKIGVSRQAVSKWETGEAMPDLQKLLLLREALDVSLDELCGLQETAVEKQTISETTAKTNGVWKILCAVLGVIVILLSMQVAVLTRHKDAETSLEIEVSEATFYSSTGYSLRYCIVPRSVNSDYTYYLLLAPETPVSGAPKKPIELDGSSGIFQGELTFPLTASRWDVSLQVEDGEKTYLIPVATDVYYKAEGIVSWESIE